MKPITLSLALSLPLALAAVAAPASAAPVPSHQPVRVDMTYRHDFRIAQQLRGEIFRLDRQIERGIAMHRIDRREAAKLYRDVDTLKVALARAERGGVDRFEARNLQFRIDQVRFKLDRDLRDGGAFGRFHR